MHQSAAAPHQRGRFALGVGGAGPLSVDGYLAKKRSRDSAARNFRPQELNALANPSGGIAHKMLSYS
jgi:hypothetical protein